MRGEQESDGRFRSTDGNSTGRGRAEVFSPMKEALCLLGGAALCERGMFGLWQRINSGIHTENRAQSGQRAQRAQSEAE